MQAKRYHIQQGYLISKLADTVRVGKNITRTSSRARRSFSEGWAVVRSRCVDTGIFFMKKLPIGEQSFEELIQTDCVYVDKTEHIYNLITENKYYFLSRPRRFGKSLLCSTFEALFKNKRELFKNTWIDKSDYDWKEYPVIHLSMAQCDLKSPVSLEESLIAALCRLAQSYDVNVMKTNSVKDLMVDVVQKLSKQGQVVVIIDEYDKPIVEHLTNKPLAQEMRDALRGFYGPFKDLGKYMRLLFITGVSKFSRTSLFSDMNHLFDLTMHRKTATLCGYTYRELEQFFTEHILHVATIMCQPVDAIRERMKEMYNGYRFEENQMDLVYNPFSVINFLGNAKFNNYWFQSGQAKFLFDLIKTKNYSIPDIKNIVLSQGDLGTFDVDSISLETLLYQTGYISIESSDGKYYKMRFPNDEVKYAFEESLLSNLLGQPEGKIHTKLEAISAALKKQDLPNFMLNLKSIFAGMPYNLKSSNEEVYYQGIFYLTCDLLGADITQEEPTNIGRIDAVMRYPDRTYVFEFKINKSKEEALKQIEEKKYCEKFMGENKSIIMVGINFMIEDRNVDPEYIIKEFKPTAS